MTEASGKWFDEVGEGDRFSARVVPGEERELYAQLGFETPFLLCLGASDARKNLALLVRAFARSGVQKDVRLLFAGPISARQRARLVQVIDAYQLGGSVRLLGYIDDALLVALYRHCLAYVFPSSYEGFGLPILEAMACGAPTLTSSVSALGEVAGDAALTLTELSEDCLSEGIRQIVSDAALRRTLRERGLSHVQAFTWERCAQETLECYERALGEMA